MRGFVRTGELFIFITAPCRCYAPRHSQARPLQTAQLRQAGRPNNAAFSAAVAYDSAGFYAPDVGILALSRSSRSSWRAVAKTFTTTCGRRLGYDKGASEPALRATASRTARFCPGTRGARVVICAPIPQFPMTICPARRGLGGGLENPYEKRN